MKRVIVIVLVMLFAAGGGIAEFMVLDIVHNPFAEEEDMAEGGEGTGAGGKLSFIPSERAPQFYPLEDLVIPIIIDGRVIKRVNITAHLKFFSGNSSAVENALSLLESTLNENLLVHC
jgi:hypothetical protein